MVSRMNVSLITVHIVDYKCNGEQFRKHYESKLTSKEISMGGDIDSDTGPRILNGLCWFKFSLQLPLKCDIPTLNVLEGTTVFNYYVKVSVTGPSFGDRGFNHMEPFRVVPIGTFQKGCFHPNISEVCTTFVRLSRMLNEERVYHINRCTENTSSFLPNMPLSIYNVRESIIDTEFLVSEFTATLFFFKAILNRSEIVCNRPLPIVFSIGCMQGSILGGLIYQQYIKARLVAKLDLKVDTHLGTTEQLQTEWDIDLGVHVPEVKQLVLNSNFEDRFYIDNIRITPDLCCQFDLDSPEAFMISKFLIPSFSSDRLSISYKLQLTLGFSASERVLHFSPADNPISEVSIEFENVCIHSQLFLDFRKLVSTSIGE